MEELIIKETEFKQELVNAINNSGLPAFMLEPMLKDIYEQVQREKERQYQEAVMAKEKETKKKEGKEDAEN